MDFDIENVPLPAGRQNTLTATIRKLNVGQSFLIPNDKITDNTQKGIYTIAKAVGRSVTTRSVAEGLRVWRIDDSVENEAEIVTDVKLPEPVADQTHWAIREGHNLDSEPVAIVPVDDWIEMPQTFENGEILYWRRKLKGKPECYRRESNLMGA